jgi:hypothetical protein
MEGQPKPAELVHELERALSDSKCSTDELKEVLVLFEMAYRELSGKSGVEVKETYTRQDLAEKLSQVKTALTEPRDGYDSGKVFVELETARRKLNAN